MKRSILIFTLILFSSFYSKAALRGGEIGWECITQGADQGKLIFFVKLYRSCDSGSAALPTSVNIQNPLYGTYGGVSSISCTKRSSIDISPQCHSGANQIKCGASGLLGRAALEVNEYRSNPVQINGTPSAGGSAFSYTVAGRPSTLNATGNTYFLRAVMFPYTDPATGKAKSLGNNTSGPSCYDSSPKFTEDLQYLSSLGKSTWFSHHAYDKECDSIHYSPSVALISATSVASWKSGYSTPNPLPYASNNIALSLNSLSGSAHHLTYGQSGLYQMCFKASGYKHHQKVAEVYRDYIMVLDSSTSSNIPTIELKHAKNLNYQSSFEDTVHVGDSLHLNIRVFDIDMLSSNIGESVSVKILQHSAMSSPLNTYGCTFNSCATVDTNTTYWNGSLFQDTGSVILDFKWKIECEHLRRCGVLNDLDPNFEDYYFTIMAYDNACTKPSVALKTFRITVSGQGISDIPIQEVTYIDTMANVAFGKQKLGNFQAYLVYRSDSSNGPFTLVDSIVNINDTNYLDSTALSNGSGHFYKVVSAGSIQCFKEENTTGSVVLNVDDTSGFDPILHWNEPYHAGPRPVAVSYDIESDTGNGWFLLAGFSYGYVNHFVDTINRCQENINYRIKAFDWQYVVRHTSNVDSARYEFPVHYYNERICFGDSILIGGTYEKAPGKFLDIYSSKDGCDSTVVINLTVEIVDKGVTSNGKTLTASAKNASYQWYSCDGDSLVNDTNQSYTPAVKGNYAVIVSENNCTDTSDCVEIESTDVREIGREISLQVFPNPADAVLHFQLAGNSAEDAFQLKIYSLTGKIHYQQNISLPYVLTTSEITDGMYFYTLESNTKQYSGRIIVNHRQ